MTLFKRDHVDPILTGKKTQTRRNWKSARVKVGSIQLAKTKMLSKEFFCKLKITKIWKEKLGDISIEDCKKELCDTQEEYLDLFWDINKKKLKKLGWTRETIKDFEVYAVSFIAGETCFQCGKWFKLKYEDDFVCSDECANKFFDNSYNLWSGRCECTCKDHYLYKYHDGIMQQCVNCENRAFESRKDMEFD